MKNFNNKCSFAGVCDRDLDNYGNQNYIWPKTTAGKTARLFCHFGPILTDAEIDLVKSGVATRECLLKEDFDRGTVSSGWSEPDYSNCVKVCNFVKKRMLEKFKSLEAFIRFCHAFSSTYFHTVLLQLDLQ